MHPEFEPARLEDVGELLDLYRLVYGATYALPLGTDPAVMAAEIAAETTTWLVARDGGRIVASILATVAPHDRLGKVQGLVVHPECRGSGIANRASRAISEHLFAAGTVDSVYGTARTTAIAPQRLWLKNDYHALGIFPNFRKAAQHETMALVARYRDGVLARRHRVERVPAELGRIVKAIDSTVGMPVAPELADTSGQGLDTEPVRLELIEAEHYVRRAFDAALPDPVRRFYPLHRPNVLLAAVDGSFELYAHLSRSDGYCTLIGAAPTPMAVLPYLDTVIDVLGGLGAYYVEALVPLTGFDELACLLAHGFLPAAMYPAMRHDGECFHDYVVLARTTYPLSFRGLAIDEAFRPFVEQYIELWTDRHLNTMGVFR